MTTLLLSSFVLVLLWRKWSQQCRPLVLSLFSFEKNNSSNVVNFFCHCFVASFHYLKKIKQQQQCHYFILSLLCYKEVDDNTVVIFFFSIFETKKIRHYHFIFLSLFCCEKDDDIATIILFCCEENDDSNVIILFCPCFVAKKTMVAATIFFYPCFATKKMMVVILSLFSFLCLRRKKWQFLLSFCYK